MIYRINLGKSQIRPFQEGYEMLAYGWLKGRKGFRKLAKMSYIMRERPPTLSC